ncbi:hypothetical protein HNQ77_004863 [Silvibacterium bohemicum]|uniref:Bacterial Ig-like domain-containing protein n=1 Tax=Silvibacterium bohemicum TaxID=1577686 RepID=A0A841JZU5_9BACT|nr:Ig-like domain-containing protein [Silvibacterium bohemicum]MBB6146882.1 hypothetical protein [Silvibacterium bohemicum]
MNLQWLRHGNCTRTGIKGAGLALAALMISTWTCTGANAWAQIATRIQLSTAQQSASDSPQTVFTAKVADVSGSPVNTGTVSFESAKGSIGSAVVENGAATLTVDSLPPAANSITAVYQGSANYASSSAAVTAQATAAPAVPDFTVTATPSSLTVSPGGFGTTVISITPINGFSEMVTLSCSGNPAPSTCVFSPTTVIPANGAVATSTLQIQTQGAAGKTTLLVHPSEQQRNSSGHVAYAVVLPGILALLGIGALRKRSGWAGLRALGFVALLAASGFGLSACNVRYDYLNKPPAANPGIAAGTYTMTLAAYGNDGTSVTSHTINLTLTVN